MRLVPITVTTFNDFQSDQLRSCLRNSSKRKRILYRSLHRNQKRAFLRVHFSEEDPGTGAGMGASFHHNSWQVIDLNTQPNGVSLSGSCNLWWQIIYRGGLTWRLWVKSLNEFPRRNKTTLVFPQVLAPCSVLRPDHRNEESSIPSALVYFVFSYL